VSVEEADSFMEGCLESLANPTLEQVLSADMLLVCRGYTRMSTVIIERRLVKSAGETGRQIPIKENN